MTKIIFLASLINEKTTNNFGQWNKVFKSCEFAATRLTHSSSNIHKDQSSMHVRRCEKTWKSGRLVMKSSSVANVGKTYSS